MGYLRGIFGVSSGGDSSGQWRVESLQLRVEILLGVMPSVQQVILGKDTKRFLIYFNNSQLLHYYIITYFYESIYSIYSIFHPKYFAQTSPKMDDFWGHLRGDNYYIYNI